MAARQFLAGGVYLLPLCFAAGLALNEWREAQRRLDELVEKRVRQRLGEWAPPRLRDEVRGRRGRAVVRRWMSGRAGMRTGAPGFHGCHLPSRPPLAQTRAAMMQERAAVLADLAKLQHARGPPPPPGVAAVSAPA